ncbi:MAG: hypothetical protein V4660_08655 [Pseudomonadota bacterium]
MNDLEYITFNPFTVSAVARPSVALIPFLTWQFLDARLYKILDHIYS